VWQPFAVGLHCLHGLRGQCDACRRGGRHAWNEGRCPLPGHGRRPLEPGGNRLAEGAMPRGCHEASAALKGGGRALGGRRRDQTHRHLRRRHTRHHPLHAWGAAPGMCRAVLALEPPRDPGGQPHTDGLPPRRAASRQAVTGPVGEPPRHQPFLTRWAEDADGGQRGRWRHSVLDRRDEGATRAPTRAGAPLCWWLEHPGSDVRRRLPLQRPDGSRALRRSACPLRGWGGG
jgi:hypothetical protein